MRGMNGAALTKNGWQIWEWLPAATENHEELCRLFAPSKTGLVYVTAFPTGAGMWRYPAKISWETEVWCADAPSHLIHFNGERFLGPYG